jgi:alkanesulfonate monooxygenase SsuD/methylene tetrahydromethanopterin reductase-like flavin-dependent oxidoreductase (luciferase family)
MAVRTRRWRLGIGVLVIPYRNPALAAKSLATVDVLTGGRVTLGAGVGWLKESFEAGGTDYEHRGAVTDEFIDAMPALWTEAEPRFNGRHFTDRFIDQVVPLIEELWEPVELPVVGLRSSS